MTRLLQALFGRLPIGWLQLTHSRTRFAAALAGVAFANVLVFVQLGIMNSMAAATFKPYGFFQADIMISAGDANALNEGANVARQWMFQALADPEVASGTGLFVGNVSWERGDRTISLTTFGIDPVQPEFLVPSVAARTGTMDLPAAGVLDRATRGLPADLAASIRPQSPLTFEAGGTALTIHDTFAGGGGFGSDGFLLVSDQTYLTLFPARTSGAPDHILLRLVPGADPDTVAARLRAILSDKTLRVRSYADAAQEDLTYQQTRRPTGIIFGFGVIIGILVGIVIVYQVLSTDVADHLGEYATFKAMGYGHGFFLGIVFEQALILGVLGFVPGFLVASLILTAMAAATTLPLAMTWGMAAMVFAGTVLASSVSGAVATRRLAAADPADLF